MLLTGDADSHLPDYKKEDKMKKILSLVLVLVFMGTSLAYGVDINGDTELGVGGMGPKRYVIQNLTTAVGGVTKVTLIPLSILPAGKCVILSVTLTEGDQTYTSNRTVAIHDAGNIGWADNQNLEGEAESADADAASIPFVRPLPIVNGAVISQGINTIVTVEYQRTKL